jgi:hypothetical protein
MGSGLDTAVLGRRGANVAEQERENGGKGKRGKPNV